MKKWSISGVTILSSEKQVNDGNIIISGEKIQDYSEERLAASVTVDIDGGVLVPGLINSHDHLLGTYWPKVGKGPYENWLPWDNDLKSSPVYQERQQIENRDLYLLGGFRNLISGVTTVSDHIPHFVAEPYYDILPTNVIRDYALAHSVASFALGWGDGIDLEYQKAIREDIPFITHIAEGFDNETVKDLETLERLGGLGENSVLVHGIAFSESDMNLIKARDASVVWCGDSNIFMFDTTTNIKMLLDKNINVCIGTDSPMSGGQNILTEMKFDKDYYSEKFGEEISDKQIFRMVTENPRKAFRFKDRGLIEKGHIADLTVFRNKGGKPESSVVSAELADVLLVVIKGRPVYGDAAYENLFSGLGLEYQHVVIDGADKIITGDLKGLMKRISRAVGFKKEFPFLPVEFDF